MSNPLNILAKVVLKFCKCSHSFGSFTLKKKNCICLILGQIERCQVCQEAERVQGFVRVHSLSREQCQRGNGPCSSGERVYVHANKIYELLTETTDKQ